MWWLSWEKTDLAEVWTWVQFPVWPRVQIPVAVTVTNPGWNNHNIAIRWPISWAIITISWGGECWDSMNSGNITFARYGFFQVVRVEWVSYIQIPRRVESKSVYLQYSCDPCFLEQVGHHPFCREEPNPCCRISLFWCFQGAVEWIDNWYNTWGKWDATKGAPATLSTNTSLGGGVEKKNRKWIMNCKSCGWNESHTSKYHGEWNQNQSTFSIPATRVFWSKLGTVPSAEKSPTPAAGSASSGVSKGQLSGLIIDTKLRLTMELFCPFWVNLRGC